MVEAPVLDRIELHTRPVLDMDEKQFFDFCQINDELRIERSADGDIIIMTPECGSSGYGNTELNFYFRIWAKADGTGKVFGPSTGFILPNKAMRSPDVAWVLNSRLDKLSDEEWNQFLPLCPDFVAELRSPTDRLGTLQKKMDEYIANGARLGWLLDPMRKQVHIYRPRKKPEILDEPTEISGDPVLRSFTLDVLEIWAAVLRER
jgi:Uma2 family endonuclease